MIECTVPKCTICGEYLRHTGMFWRCDACEARYCREVIEQNDTPPGVQKRFFRFGDWQNFRMIELERDRGDISADEARRRADALIADILARQEQTLSQEQRMDEAARDRRRKYLY